MGEHHKESPSHYNAWQHCIHWEGVDRSTDESNEGTRAHAELERGLKDMGYDPDLSVSRWARDAVYAECDGIEPQSEVRLEGDKGTPLAGIFGTADVLWQDKEGFLHIADLKTFSDGTEDYSAQLKGYAALWARKDTPSDLEVFLHVLHGGIRKVETFHFSLMECVWDTDEMLREVRERKSGPSICKYCQYCKHIKECKAVSNAVEVVNNNAVQFGSMSLPQKLVVCEAIEKLIKSLKDEAKEKAIENGGVLEADGIRYEVKERAGKGKCDILELASNLCGEEMGFDGDRILKTMTQDELITMCELPKSKVVALLKEKNANNKSVKKVEIEKLVSSYYTPGEPTQYLSRTK